MISIIIIVFLSCVLIAYFVLCRPTSELPNALHSKKLKSNGDSVNSDTKTVHINVQSMNSNNNNDNIIIVNNDVNNDASSSDDDDIAPNLNHIAEVSESESDTDSDSH